MKQWLVVGGGFAAIAIGIVAAPRPAFTSAAQATRCVEDGRVATPSVVSSQPILGQSGLDTLPEAPAR